MVLLKVTPSPSHLDGIKEQKEIRILFNRRYIPHLRFAYKAKFHFSYYIYHPKLYPKITKKFLLSLSV